jgi:antitoxin YefM
MPIKTSYSNARAKLASLCDAATLDREVVIIHRRGAEDVALISADELSSLMETAYLLKSPKNATRLLTALQRAQQNKQSPMTLDDLCQEVGLAKETST